MGLYHLNLLPPGPQLPVWELKKVGMVVCLVPGCGSSTGVRFLSGIRVGALSLALGGCGKKQVKNINKYKTNSTFLPTPWHSSHLHYTASESLGLEIPE